MSDGCKPTPLSSSRFQHMNAPKEVWIVGTSHLSEQSEADVTRAIEALKPSVVAVELCNARAAVLSEDAPLRAPAGSPAPGAAFA